eukprot:2459066-Pleurochrysis_carterae.AAC.1
MADRGTARKLIFPCRLLLAPVVWPTQSWTAIGGLTRTTGTRIRAIGPVSFPPLFSNFVGVVSLVGRMCHGLLHSLS